MKLIRRTATGVALLAAVLWILAAPRPGSTADEPDVLMGDGDRGVTSERVRSLFPELADLEFAEGGVEACLECHDETEEHSILPILQRSHGMQGDSRTPLAQEYGCQTCHGPSAAHVEEPEKGEERAPVAISYEPDSATPVAVRNEVCLSCHEGGLQINWKGSPHEGHELDCATCHNVHDEEDPMLVRNISPETWRREGQLETCTQCHPQQRAQMHRLSSHPIKEGKVQCSDCHNPHGGPTDSQLARTTLNQTCYQCHAEKRGPFLWEHAPVREDCSICHEPHGSNHKSLLNANTPWLCQRCHMAGYHPSTAYSGEQLPGNSPNGKFLGKNCQNCHVEVHGSNHPSGPRFTR